MDWRRAGLSEWQQTLEGASVPKKRRVDFGAFALARSTLTALRFVRASMPAGEQALTALRFVRASMPAGGQALTTLRFASLRARLDSVASCAPRSFLCASFPAPGGLSFGGENFVWVRFRLGWDFGGATASADGTGSRCSGARFRRSGAAWGRKGDGGLDARRADSDGAVEARGGV